MHGNETVIEMVMALFIVYDRKAMVRLDTLKGEKVWQMNIFPMESGIMRCGWR